MDLYAICEYLGACIEPADTPNAPIEGIVSIGAATSDQLTFCVDSAKSRIDTQAYACIAHAPLENCPTIVSNNPYRDFARVQQLFYPQPVVVGQDINETSIVDKSVRLPANIRLGPYCVIGANAVLEDGVIIDSHCHIGQNTHVGANTRISPQVFIGDWCIIGQACLIQAGVKIGGDGFGFVPNKDGTWERIPQTGRVVIGDRVSIGNGTCIDRGTLQDTVIESDVIIDNLVHIAHNVHIGAGSALAGQTGIAGSARIGKQCQFGGQTAIAGHIELVDNVVCVGQAMVTNSIKEKGMYAGKPALPIKEWRRNAVHFKRLHTYTFQKRGDL